jgi:hypothetical protein
MPFGRCNKLCKICKGYGEEFDIKRKDPFSRKLAHHRHSEKNKHDLFALYSPKVVTEKYFTTDSISLRGLQ